MCGQSGGEAATTPDIFFALAELFSPSLVIHAERRFLASRFDPDVFNSWSSKGLADVDAQRTMNHVHISTLFQDQEVLDAVASEAARVLAGLWTHTLGPHGLEVGVTGTTLEDASVTFWDAADPKGERPR